MMWISTSSRMTGRLLATEFARYGIRVNTISPGFIGTEMVRSMKPEALSKLQAMIPAGRIGEPDEISRSTAAIVWGLSL